VAAGTERKRSEILCPNKLPCGRAPSRQPPDDLWNLPHEQERKRKATYLPQLAPHKWCRGWDIHQAKTLLDWKECSNPTFLKLIGELKQKQIDLQAFERQATYKIFGRQALASGSPQECSSMTSLPLLQHDGPRRDVQAWHHCHCCNTTANSKRIKLAGCCNLQSS